MTTKTTIGNKIRVARSRQIPRLRQRDVDDLVGVPHGRTAHYENGRAAAPHVYLMRLSNAWNIPVSWFLSPTSDEPPVKDPASSATSSGVVSIDLKPTLPVGDWDEPSRQQTEVDAKFAKSGAFACQILGEIMAPRILHRDLVIFWPTDKPKIGIVSLVFSPAGKPTLVIPEYNAKTGDVDYVVPASEGHVIEGDMNISAYAVGIVRQLPDGDLLTRANFSGIHLHGS